MVRCLCILLATCAAVAPAAAAAEARRFPVKPALTEPAPDSKSRVFRKDRKPERLGPVAIARPSDRMARTEVRPTSAPRPTVMTPSARRGSSTFKSHTGTHGSAPMRPRSAVR
ncbi:MAG: hypothetical protein JNK11_10990 [Alphaproteobacteria bacterium]|nr:hypothetical protein [Alphaproteobacteria bacterium]